MEGELFDVASWKPLASYGFTHPFFTLNKEILINTWISLGILFAVSCAARLALARPYTISGRLVTNTVSSFATMVEQSVHRPIPRYVYFIASIFIFIFVCNSVVLIPGMEEPTQDINTTLALGIIAFMYAQKEGIKAHGLGGYISEYFAMPFSVVSDLSWHPLSLTRAACKLLGNIVMALFSFPLEVLGKLASIVSLSLRLFGNIFGGSIITRMFHQAIAGHWLWQTLALVTGLNLIIALFFGLFESVIQAFVFAILSLTYITMARQ